jgi:hypothetical protein
MVAIKVKQDLTLLSIQAAGVAVVDTTETITMGVMVPLVS